MRQTNYIQHLNTFFATVFEDERLAPTHISLYMALFQFWNQHRFSMLFSVARSDLMELSKIKSKTTYSKCLRDLDAWQYIMYEPSNNPLARSKFRLVNIWSTSWPQFNTSVKTTSPLNGPPLDGSSSVNGPPVTDTSPLDGLPLVPLYKTYKQKHINVEAPPDQNMVVDFFLSQNGSKAEALKFWNHYESTSWKSGNSKITNWQAAAAKWLIGDKQRNAKGLVQKMDYLHTTKNKDYDKPL